MCMPDGWSDRFHVAEDAMVSGSDAWRECSEVLLEEYPWMAQLSGEEVGAAVRDFSRGLP